MKYFAQMLVLLVIIGCATPIERQLPPLPPNKKLGVLAKEAMVVSARQEASAIGLQILRKGGNAYDAMMATEMALAVAFPYAGNLGGGGFMVYRHHDGTTGSLDYREKAPLLASKNMYLDSLGNVIPGKSTVGAMAVGVPGTVAGIFAVHEKFGTLPIAEILQPVVDLAKSGVIITPSQAERLNKYQETFEEVNGKPILLSQPYQAGDTLINLALAKTLERMIIHGRKDFYQGKTATMMVQYVQENGGILSLEDLDQYEAVWRKPIIFDYDELTIISMAPPSSGGICLAQILKSIERYDFHSLNHNSVPMIQVITEAERRSYADRSQYLGDPDFVKIPMKELIDSSYLAYRMADFSFEQATKSADISHGNVQVIESNETTHYSIVDAEGNAVSVTTTLNSPYGSKLFSDELGFFFNNEMDDFSAKPGTPNVYGLVGAEANAILPQKRMLSSMTPTIVEKEGQLWFTVGTPGGSTIITSVLQTILNIHEYNMGAQEAVSQPRFHHQWLPDEIRIEPLGFEQEILDSLMALGYAINEENASVIGKVEVILVREDGTLEGGADPRGDDQAVGY